MKLGKIYSINSKFGTIVFGDDVVDFDTKDISFNESLSVGDVVEFRLEVKFPNILIARNIKKADGNFKNS